jgi:DNA-binding Xre family transcriptional regulator
VAVRVTVQLIEWLSCRMQERNLSYSELGRQSGLAWQSWQRLMNHTTKEIKDDTVDAICLVFGLSRDQLADVASGKVRTSNAKHDGISRKSEALWRWLNHDPQRCGALRAMGYKGDLPK